MAGPSPPHSFIDVGANLLDDMFLKGEYNGSQKHPSDLEHVLGRAWDAGLSHIIITAGNLDEARRALELAGSDRRLFSTVGVHPTRCGEFAQNEEGGPDLYLDTLMELAQDGRKAGKVVAIGECGLDYDRLRFCDRAEQLEGFERQFALAKETGLPMFLVRYAGFVAWCYAVAYWMVDALVSFDCPIKSNSTIGTRAMILWRCCASTGSSSAKASCTGR